MKARFAEVPEAIWNTLEVAEKCSLEIEFGKLHYPVSTRPAAHADSYLRERLVQGSRRATA